MKDILYRNGRVSLKSFFFCLKMLLLCASQGYSRIGKKGKKIPAYFKLKSSKYSVSKLSNR